MRNRCHHRSWIAVIVATCFLGLAVGGTARAELVRADLVPGSGDGKLVRDTSNHLDWLRLVESQGQSAADFVEGGVGGYSSLGFNLATAAQVENLFRAGGLLTLDASFLEESYAPATTLIDLLGCVQGCDGGLPAAQGWIQAPDIADNVVQGVVQTSACCPPAGRAYVLSVSSVPKTTSSDVDGVFLVRETPGVLLSQTTWTEANGHIYAIVDLPGTDWSTAATDLQKLLPGYHLATITSQREQDFVWQFLVDTTGGAWEWWLGGFQEVDVETDPAANWKWVNGERWSYTAWRSGEPNDAGGLEDHLAMEAGLWNDEGTAISAIGGYIAELGRFDDVAVSHWAFRHIETVARVGIAAGCGRNNFCPASPVTRAQLAVFLERGMRGSDFIPPPASGTVFLDVAAGDFAAAFIEQLYLDGITAGCGGLKYCPSAKLTRDQMAVFLLRAKHGAGYSPPPATGTFTDVTLSHWAVHWIEQLAREGITAGCGSGKYCPDAVVTRDQMAVFLVRTFGL